MRVQVKSSHAARILCSVLVATACLSRSTGATFLVQVTITVPFGPHGAPLAPHSPHQHPTVSFPFQLSLQHAFQQAVTQIVTGTYTTPSYVPPIDGFPHWECNTSSIPQTATIDFEYSIVWISAIRLLAAQPQLILVAEPDGKILAAAYGAIAGVTVHYDLPTDQEAPAAFSPLPQPPSPAPLAPPLPAISTSHLVITTTLVLDTSDAVFTNPEKWPAFQAAFLIRLAAAIDVALSALLDDVDVLLDHPACVAATALRCVKLPGAKGHKWQKTITAVYILVDSKAAQLFSANATLVDRKVTKSLAPRYNIERLHLSCSTSGKPLLLPSICKSQIPSLLPPPSPSPPPPGPSSSIYPDPPSNPPSGGSFYPRPPNSRPSVGASGDYESPPPPSYTGGGHLPAPPNYRPSVGYGPGAPSVRSTTRHGGARHMKRSRTLLMEPHREAAAMHPSDLQPSDMAYGIDSVLYELFTAVADQFTAGAICSARGGRLTDYEAEGASVFVDVLCGGTPEQKCWVEGGSLGRCTAIAPSRLMPLPCAERLPFICATAADASENRFAAQALPAIVTQPPKDVSESLDDVMYELFDTPLDYFTAGRACLVRGAMLVEYALDLESQKFVDLLCEHSRCWVHGNKADRCSAVESGVVVPTDCTSQQLPYLCVTAVLSR